MNKKTKSKLFVLTALVMVSLILTACGNKEPEMDIDAQKTAFAQTAAVQATMTAEAVPTETPTPEVSPTPTITATISGTTVGIIYTSTPTGSAPEPTTSVPVSGNDGAAWRANDPPDNTVFSPGESFTVTWTIENTGTSTWTTGYYISFLSGDQMGAEDEIYLPYSVPPGTNVQITVNFVAPEATGTKQSDWVLKNANGDTFYSFYIIVEVK
ncbi:MAG: hypothetical protein H0S79_21490 [Anaerolineaceae bacterium]|nr:hypothetical protein [Anaerolineaceae bacterium]